MTALAADTPLPHRGDPKIREYPVTGADTFYVGAIVVFDLTGGLVQVQQGAADIPCGIVVEQLVATAASQLVKVATGGEWLLPFTGAVVGDTGSLIHVDASASDDNPTALLAAGDGATGDLAFGTCVEFVSATLGGWVDIEKRGAIAAHA